ncbi:MAG: TRAP transporter substrate-binding protein [Pseudolabrys sp.]|nr:TRAP transporter substrate-binding protein [Pseudolabrys sp.]MBV9955643.1 TRAP transporter substrate-binding protein [Pseudolabrys sp.]
MASPIKITMSGYGPPSTGFSKSLVFIGDRIKREFGDRIAIDYVFNIMDHGHKAEDIIPRVEDGTFTMGYQSSSYLTDRVPELGFVDLPFLFSSNAQARGAMDGALGKFLEQKTEEKCNYRILGWFENGFRHISNKLRPIHTPADMKGMKIRVLPSEIHRRTFELLGAQAMRMDLTEAIKMVVAGTLDAQENPLANTVTYGVHKFHKFHTLTNHFYISRPIFFNRDAFDSWPQDLQEAMRRAVKDAVLAQRKLAEQEHEDSKKAIEAEGCVFNALTPAEHAKFVAAVQPLLNDASKMFGDQMFKMVPK